MLSSKPIDLYHSQQDPYIDSILNLDPCVESSMPSTPPKPQKPSKRSILHEPVQTATLLIIFALIPFMLACAMIIWAVLWIVEKLQNTAVKNWGKDDQTRENSVPRWGGHPREFKFNNVKG